MQDNKNLLREFLGESFQDEHLNESLTLDASNDLWVNGTTTARFNVASHRFNQPISVTNPLFMTNNVKYALRYSDQHVSGDFAGGNKMLAAYGNALKRGDGLIVFMRLKKDVKLFDISKPLDPSKLKSDDYETLGIDPKFRAIFAKCEPYYALNTNVGADIDKRPIEYVIATKYLIFMNAKNMLYSTDKLDNKTLYSGDPDTTVLKSLFIKNGDSLGYSASHDSYAEFIEHYNSHAFKSDERDPETGRRITTRDKKASKLAGQTIVVNEKNPELPDSLTDSQLELVNLYLEFFDYLLTYASSLGVTSADDVNTDNIESTAKVLLGDDNITVSKFVDALQLFLQLKIAEAFDGYYCPEYRGDDTSQTPGDAIALFNAEFIQQYRAFDMREITTVNSELNSSTGSFENRVIDAFNKVRENRIAQKRLKAQNDKVIELNRQITTVLNQKKWKSITARVQYKDGALTKTGILYADSLDTLQQFMKRNYPRYSILANYNTSKPLEKEIACLLKTRLADAKYTDHVKKMLSIMSR